MNKKIIMTAVIAAVYATLTIFLAPLSYGAVQLRLSEIVTLLAFINPSFTPGLVIGCMIANIFSPFGIIDVLIGSIATFFAVYPMRYTKNLYIASLMPVISNAVIVGLEIAILSALPKIETIFYVGVGEFAAVSICGVIFIKLISKNQKLMDYLKNN